MRIPPTSTTATHDAQAARGGEAQVFKPRQPPAANISALGPRHSQPPQRLPPPSPALMALARKVNSEVTPGDVQTVTALHNGLTGRNLGVLGRHIFGPPVTQNRIGHELRTIGMNMYNRGGVTGSIVFGTLDAALNGIPH
jgi:hypothetical protein